MNAAASELGVACVQLTPRRGDLEGNLERGLAEIAAAAGEGHELIVLPELSNSGYAFADRSEAWALAEDLSEGPSCRGWRQAARDLGVWIVAGLAERDGDHLFDTAVVIDRNGELVSRYRKMHLWSTEHLWFEAGREPSEILSLPFGRLAVGICFDLWVPELFRHYAQRGADIVCLPSNWSSPATVNGAERPIVDFLATASAHVNALFLAGADRGGSDGPFDFLGASLIVNPRGEMVSRAAIPACEAERVSARVDLMEARVRKTWSRFNRAAEPSGHLLAHTRKEGSE